MKLWFTGKVSNNTPKLAADSLAITTSSLPYLHAQLQFLFSQSRLVVVFLSLPQEFDKHQTWELIRLLRNPLNVLHQ